MKTRVVCSLLAVLIPLATTAGASDPARAELIETGESFHGDEMPARTGQEWLGLFVTGTESKLEPVTIRVVRCLDPIVDEDERTKTGKAVSVPGRRNPVFLVRNVPELKPSAVTTVHGYHVDLLGKSDVTLTLGDVRHRLWVESTATHKRLGLSADGSAQTLYAVKQPSDDEGWSLMWAGDMDGDGKLDLYVDASDHYNVSERRLYLSSRAPNGGLVGQVAVFRITGC